jgi:hypothetical protein
VMHTIMDQQPHNVSSEWWSLPSEQFFS